MKTTLGRSLLGGEGRRGSGTGGAGGVGAGGCGSGGGGGGPGGAGPSEHLDSALARSHSGASCCMCVCTQARQDCLPSVLQPGHTRLSLASQPWPWAGGLVRFCVGKRPGEDQRGAPAARPRCGGS